jgi:hypothetical protein
MNRLLRQLPLMRNCKEVSALLVAREDRDLPWTERAALRVHMAMCRTCPRFEAQVLTMRNAMRQWRHYSNEAADTAQPATEQHLPQHLPRNPPPPKAAPTASPEA